MDRKNHQIKQLKGLLLQAWSLESSSKWTAENPACGQCGVTALVVQDVLGGELLKTPLSEGWHFYNLIGGETLDFTASQFSKPIQYHGLAASREEAFGDTNQMQYTYLRRRVLGLWNQ
ncbi:YunG family protein [Paenibacillus tengchongensis]|uniref:YunG family protein n=1 Tax=Paenibacillus tengchongensis TaxID=2608684 RepID=UPI00124D29BA|nr:hypothetical protein [Paenibacillus tengchongensis]